MDKSSRSSGGNDHHNKESLSSYMNSVSEKNSNRVYVLDNAINSIKTIHTNEREEEEDDEEEDNNNNQRHEGQILRHNMTNRVLKRRRIMRKKDVRDGYDDKDNNNTLVEHDRRAFSYSGNDDNVAKERINSVENELSSFQRHQPDPKEEEQEENEYLKGVGESCGATDENNTLVLSNGSSNLEQRKIGEGGGGGGGGGDTRRCDNYDDSIFEFGNNDDDEMNFITETDRLDCNMVDSSHTPTGTSSPSVAFPNPNPPESLSVGLNDNSRRVRNNQNGGNDGREDDEAATSFNYPIDRLDVDSTAAALLPPVEDGEGEEETGEATATDTTNNTALGSSETELESEIVGQCGQQQRELEWYKELYDAIKAGNTEHAVYLIRLGENRDKGGGIGNNVSGDMCGAGAYSCNLNSFLQMQGLSALAVACSKGYLSVVKVLLDAGADPSLHSTQSGSTPLIQACHFGHVHVVRCLLRHPGVHVDKANYKCTTALMRAAQEGHGEIVDLLLRHHADVRRKNHEQMTPIMLASQRGHAKIVRRLIEAGADIDGKTAQDSTPLMLACKRGNSEVVKVLVASGTELMHRDSKGRTALDNALKRHLTEIASYLRPEMQLHLMRMEARRVRSFCISRVYRLLQQERALVRVRMVGTGITKDVTIHDVTFAGLTRWDEGHSIISRNERLGEPCLSGLFFVFNHSRRALILTMALLPEPLVENVAEYLPLPHLFDTQLEALRNRCHIDPDSTVKSSLDLIDEVLAEGGFAVACDKTNVAPPMDEFSSWVEWAKWGRECDRAADAGKKAGINSICRSEDGTEHEMGLVSSLELRPAAAAVGAAVVEEEIGEENDSFPGRTKIPWCPRMSMLEARRRACFLSVLDRGGGGAGGGRRGEGKNCCSLIHTLSLPPYNIPKSVLARLKQCGDIQSITRRMRGVHFEVGVAVDMVMLTAELVSWYISLHED